mgnify:CR=1 FL=1
MAIIKKIHIAPVGGWENNSYYVVEVAFMKGNPVHEAILSIGFMGENGEYGNYCYLFNSSYDHEVQNVRKAFYLRFVRKIDMAIPNRHKLCEDINPYYLEVIYDAPVFDGVKEYTDEYVPLFKKWLKDKNAYYYSRPKEDYSENEAKELAEKAGATVLFLENLS